MRPRHTARADGSGIRALALLDYDVQNAPLYEASLNWPDGWVRPRRASTRSRC